MSALVIAAMPTSEARLPTVDPRKKKALTKRILNSYTRSASLSLARILRDLREKCDEFSCCRHVKRMCFFLKSDETFCFVILLLAFHIVLLRVP